MTDRRRVARLAALVVAGLAVAGTSASPVPPPPTQPLSTSGTVHLTAEHPVVIQPLEFVVTQGQLASLALSPKITSAPEDGSAVVSVEIVDQTGSRISEPTTGAPSMPPTWSWSFTCKANPCAARYALVVSWFDAPAGTETDVGWAVDATAIYFGNLNAGATPGQVTLSAPSDSAAEPPAAKLRTETSGKAVRLTESDRFRSWTVKLSRDDAKGTPHGWPQVAQARLAFSAAQVAGPAYLVGADGVPEDVRIRTRPDPPVRLAMRTSDGRGTTAWATDRPFVFDPFSHCAADGPCETTLTIELGWADGRPDTAFDVGWTLDLAAINATGKVTPIESAVSADPPIHLATATTSGTFDEPGNHYEPAVQFDIVAPKLADPSSDTTRVPARALVTVRATSVGTVPLPADAEISVFADSGGDGLGGNAILHPGESTTFAFEPRGICMTGAQGTCFASSSLGAVIYQPNRNTANVDGMVVRIHWSIEGGVGTIDGGSAVFNVKPQPTKNP